MVSESNQTRSHAHKLKTVYEDEQGLERLIFFSDAVFAIAITLLALDIRLPVVEGGLTDDALLQSLLAFIHEDLAKYSWLLIAPLSRYVR